MTFWVIAVLLLVLALAMLLIPMLKASADSGDGQRESQNIQIAREKKQLLQRQLEKGELDQDGYDAALLDLQQALALELDAAESLNSRSRGQWMIVVVLVLVPAMSLGLYFKYGEYRVVENPDLAQAHPAIPASQMNLDEMIITIKNRLKETPDDPGGWYALGRAMMAKRDFAQAVTAFQRTYDLAENDPGVMFSLADALAMQNNGSLLGEPATLIQRGLQLAPNYPNGLWLAGMVAEQQKNYAKAHEYWSRLLPMIADNQKSANEVRGLLSMLEQRDPALAAKNADSGTETVTVADTARLSVQVDISAELRQKAKPDDAVFVYAKAMQGPPMPLAVRKLRLQDLPATLTLGDEDAMMPSMKLSSFEQVVVGARVSFSGNPVAQSGDFFTEVESIDSSNPPESIKLNIDKVK